MLPMILGALGSGLAASSAIAMSPLIAGAIGSGIGGLLQTGDLKQGLLSGLGTFLGGSMFPGAGAAAANPANSTALSGAGGTTMGIGGLANQAAGATTPGLFGSGGGIMGMLGQGYSTLGTGGMLGGMLLPALMPPEDNFGDTPSTPTRASREPFNREVTRAPAGYRPGLDPEHKYFSPIYRPTIGMAAGGSVSSGANARMAMMRAQAAPTPAGNSTKGGGIESILQTIAQKPQRPTPMPTSMPANAASNANARMAMMQKRAQEQARTQTRSGMPFAGINMDTPAGNIFQRAAQNSLAGKGGGKTRRMAAGGITGIPTEGGTPQVAPDPERVVEQLSDKEIASAATMAIKGMLTDKEAALALGAFMQRNGEEALQRLIDDVLTGKAETYGGDREGKLEGPGDGMDDMIPAMMPAADQDVLLSDGEYIVPADVVSGLGNGSSDAGAAQLDKMAEKVRSARTGMTSQPAKISPDQMVPV